MNKDEILRISKKLGLTHIGSNLSVLPILEEIYAVKEPEDKVILDNAHAHLAHLIVRKMDHPINRIYPDMARYNPWEEAMIEKYGIHCDRCAGCDASGGSLGHGIGISIGMALALPGATIHCIVSDGSMMEGSNWEALRIIADQKIDNIQIYCNFNGSTAVAEMEPARIVNNMKNFKLPNKFTLFVTNNGDGFRGVQGHYKKL